MFFRIFEYKRNNNGVPRSCVTFNNTNLKEILVTSIERVDAWRKTENVGIGNLIGDGYWEKAFGNKRWEVKTIRYMKVKCIKTSGYILTVGKIYNVEPYINKIFGEEYYIINDVCTEHTAIYRCWYFKK